LEINVAIRNWIKVGAIILSLGAVHMTLAADPAPKPKPAPAPKPTYSGLNPKTMEPTAGTADNTAPAGFALIFNGKDLTGWKGLMKSPLDNAAKRAALSSEERAKAQEEADANMREHWKADNGVLVFDGKGRNLVIAKDYGDFEMWVDWKIDHKGDSGIYVRNCPQIQIWDPANTRFARAALGSGALYNNITNPNDPLVVADKPIGEWNTFFIRMVGDKVTVYLNGKLVTDNVVLENYWERTKPIYPTGQIELQNHHDQLWFKNIYVKELPASK
jgi:hypothetical protein